MGNTKYNDVQPGPEGPGRAVKLLTNICFREFGQHTQNDVASIGSALGIFKDMALDIFLVCANNVQH